MIVLDDSTNVFLQSAAGAPRNSVYAVVGFSAAVVTLAALFLATVYYPFVYLHLFFPVAIVSGHIARRRIQRAPSKWKGTGMAVFGLWVGYFDLLIAILVATVAIR